MKQKFFTLLLMAFIPIAMMAYDCEVNGVYFDLVKKIKAATVVGANSNNVVIPASIEYDGENYDVTNIGEFAFSYSHITSITIPSSVTSIGFAAFYVNWGMTSVIIPEGVTSIGGAAFRNCYDLTYVTIPESVTSIGEGSFDGCGKLISVRIPESVTSIGEKAFGGCTGLTSIIVDEENNFYDSRNNCNAIIETSSNTLKWGCQNTTIPNGVLIIDKNAFQGCIGLTSIAIPDGLMNIGQAAFDGCSGLNSVIIPNSVTSIDTYAFQSCSGLTSVTIGSGVNSIGGVAFARCANLEVVTCLATIVPNTQGDAFDNSLIEYATLIVPDESLETYKSTAPWSNFGTILASSQAYVVKANSYTREYGEPNPAFEYTCGTMLNGEPNIICYADEYSSPGEYPIYISKGTISNNVVTYENGTLTITKAPLVITGKNYTITEGDELPTFEVLYEGFKNGEDESVLTTLPIFSCAATSASAPGVYDIIWSGAEAQNYDISCMKGTLTIEEADVAIRASKPTLRTDKNATLSIDLNNKDELIAFEFYMTLPEGISIALDEDGYLDATLNSERSNRHTLEVEQACDGRFHFLCYSNRNNAFKGNSGELLSINLFCEEGMEPGTYQGLLSTVKFADLEENRIVLPNLSFDIEVINVTMGDVNDDGDIDVMDIVCMVNYIMERPSASFVFAAADLNEDGVVDVMDLVKEVRLVMDQTASAAPATFDMLSGDLSLMTEKDGAVALHINDAARYVASQFIVTLSHGQHLADVATDSRHTVSFEPMADNQYVVVSYSNSNATYTSNDAALTLYVKGRGQVDVENAVFVSDSKEKVSFQSVNSGYTDGIRYSTYDFTKPADIYSPSGILLRKNATTDAGLKAGVYIINGTKYIKK